MVSCAPRRGQRTGRNLNRRQGKLNRRRGIPEPLPWVGFAGRGSHRTNRRRNLPAAVAAPAGRLGQTRPASPGDAHWRTARREGLGILNLRPSRRTTIVQQTMQHIIVISIFSRTWAAVFTSDRRGNGRSILLKSQRLPRLLCCALVCAFAIGGRGFGERVHAAEFGYAGVNGQGVWSETPGWEACGGTATTAR